MKTIKVLIAAIALAAIPAAVMAKETCKDCAKCCSAKEKTCTMDCCKDKAK